MAEAIRGNRGLVDGSPFPVYQAGICARKDMVAQATWKTRGGRNTRLMALTWQGASRRLDAGARKCL